MKDDNFEYENPNELEEILYSMNDEEFSIEELEDQLGEDIFSSHKNNYLDSYLQKYKFYKEEYEANQEFINTLKDKKDDLIQNILDIISEKFSIGIDDEHRTKKVCVALYDFFVINYKENLETFYFNYIEKNKKSIIAEIKREKRQKDITVNANKAKFANSNDAIIVDNIYYILTEIIPTIDDEEFLDYVLNDDDTVTNIAIKKYIDKEFIFIDIDTFNAFIDPFMGEEDGWSDIVSDLIIRYTGESDQNELNILEEDDDDDE